VNIRQTATRRAVVRVLLASPLALSMPVQSAGTPMTVNRRSGTRCLDDRAVAVSVTSGWNHKNKRATSTSVPNTAALGGPNGLHIAHLVRLIAENMP